MKCAKPMAPHQSPAPIHLVLRLHALPGPMGLDLCMQCFHTRWHWSGPKPNPQYCPNSCPRQGTAHIWPRPSERSHSFARKNSCLDLCKPLCHQWINGDGSASRSAWLNVSSMHYATHNSMQPLRSIVPAMNMKATTCLRPPLLQCRP